MRFRHQYSFLMQGMKGYGLLRDERLARGNIAAKSYDRFYQFRSQVRDNKGNACWSIPFL